MVCVALTGLTQAVDAAGYAVMPEDDEDSAVGPHSRPLPMNSEEPSRLELVKLASAHAAQCFENKWSGGDLQVLAQMLELIKQDAGEREVIIAQTIAWSCRTEGVLALRVELLEIACRSPHASVRANAAILAGQLHRVAGRMSEEDASKVRECLGILAQDQDEGVCKNLQLSGGGSQ